LGALFLFLPLLSFFLLATGSGAGVGLAFSWTGSAGFFTSSFLFFLDFLLSVTSGTTGCFTGEATGFSSTG